MLTKRTGARVSAVLLFVALLALGCTPPQIPVMGFEPHLSMSEVPVLGKAVKVTLTFKTVAAQKGLEG